MLDEQQLHRQPLQAMHRMLSQPVNYAAEAAGDRYLANRRLRGLAQWQWRQQQLHHEQQRHHQPRVHPDRPRTFCLPDGWTSEGIWTADLVRIHSAVGSGAAPPPRKSPWEAVESPPRPAVRREQATALSAPAITRFGDEQRQLSPTPPLLLLPTRQTPPPPSQFPQQPLSPVRLSPRGVATELTPATSATSIDWVTVDPVYFAIELSAAGTGPAAVAPVTSTAASPAVSAKRHQASGGALAHIGRNGHPARSAPAAAVELTVQRQPNLCWEAEVADPAATIVQAAKPGAREAAKAASATAALEAQRRCRQVVVFDHAASASREAAVLQRLRSRSAGVGHQPQQSEKPGRLTIPADNAAIAEAVESLRRAKKTMTKEATAAKPEKEEEKAAAPQAPPPPQAKSFRSLRQPPPPAKKPLVARAFAAATFSPRYEADAGLVISTIAGNSPTATAPAATTPSLTAKRATPNRSGLLSATPLRHFNSAAPTPNGGVDGGGDYLSIVRPVPGQHLRLLQQQYEQHAHRVLRKQHQQLQRQQQDLRHQRHLQASAPMPSTPRGDEAPTMAGEADLEQDEAEAVEAMMADSAEVGEALGLTIAAAAMLKSSSFVSTVSLTSTKDSELTRSAGAVRIPTEQRKALAAAADAERELEEWLQADAADEEQDNAEIA